jgi:single-stranded-DNA-specific exonuclease
VHGVHVRDALEAVATRTPGLVEKFGGHAMAAGLTIRRARLREFAEAFAAEVAARAEPGSLDGILYSDGSLSTAELGLPLAEALRAGGPWGSGFPEPTFDGEFTVTEARVLGDRHLKMWVRPAKNAPPQEAIAFGWMARAGASVPRTGASVRLLYRLDVNEYQGQRRAQLLVDHLEELLPVNH